MKIIFSLSIIVGTIGILLIIGATIYKFSNKKHKQNNNLATKVYNVGIIIGAIGAIVFLICECIVKFNLYMKIIG